MLVKGRSSRDFGSRYVFSSGILFNYKLIIKNIIEKEHTIYLLDEVVREVQTGARSAGIM